MLMNVTLIFLVTKSRCEDGKFSHFILGYKDALFKIEKSRRNREI
jgi:hypothetical protein